MSSLSFYATKTLAALILPPAGPVLLALFFLVLCMKAKRPGWRTFTGALAALSLLSLFALSIPLVATALTAPLNRYPVISDDALKQAQAIVILGGGARYGAPEYGGQDTVKAETLERLRYGAGLAKKTKLPVLVTGGTVYRGRPEGESMREALADFGVAPRWVETASRNTIENASLSAAILKKDGITKIALVSHSTHLTRAVPLFQQQGLTVLAAPMGFTTTPPSWLEALLPGNLVRSREALHEYLGLLFNRLLRSGA